MLLKDEEFNLKKKLEEALAQVNYYESKSHNL